MTAAAEHRPVYERHRVLVLAAAAVMVELVYWFVVTAGTFTHWHFYDAFINDLADGFRQWHLHLAVEPPAALLSKPNPFDPANRSLWYWDVSLYKGHYYLYWGPVPALLLAAVKTLFRISRQVGDEPVTFALASLQLVVGTLFIERAGRRLFSCTPLVLEIAAVFALGLSNPTPYNLARASVYEAAIIGGQAFLLLGLVFAFDAVWKAPRRRRALLAAGISWAAAFGCRASLGPAIGILIAVTVIALAFPKQERWPRAVRGALWLGTPAAAGLLLLLGYNRLRFGAWFDFGRTRQLNWIDFHTSAAFVGPNLYAYLRRPPIWSCRFPFAYSILDMGMRAFPPHSVLPHGYFVYEEVAGMLPTAPWIWLGLLALVAVARTVCRERSFGPLAWAVSATAFGGIAAIAPLTALSTATNRYLGDIVGLAALLGALGAFATVEALRERARIRVAAIAGILLLATVTAGTGCALGIKGQYGHFQQNNLPLYDRLVRTLSICRGHLPPEPK